MGDSPNKFGLGEYEEDEAFSLKSGNKPKFKVMGATSPNNYGTPGNLSINNFGLSPGDSPYRQEDDDDNGGGDDKEKSNDTTLDPVEGGESGWKKALKIGVAGLTGGLDAVYGTGKVIPLVSNFKKKKAVEDNPVSTEIKEDIKNATGLGDDKGSKKNMSNEDWTAGQDKAKEMGHNMDDLLSKQKSLEKGSDEWKENQDIINEALGNDKRHKKID